MSQPNRNSQNHHNRNRNGRGNFQSSNRHFHDKKKSEKFTFENIHLDIFGRNSLTLDRFKQLFKIRIASKAADFLWIIDGTPETPLIEPIEPVGADSMNPTIAGKYLADYKVYLSDKDKRRDQEKLFSGELLKCVSTDILAFIDKKDRKLQSDLIAKSLYDATCEAYHSSITGGDAVKKIAGEKFFNSLVHPSDMSPTIFANRLQDRATECETQYGCAAMSEKELVAHFFDKLNSAYTEFKVKYRNE
jgi:hypothetical protein